MRTAVILFKPAAATTARRRSRRRRRRVNACRCVRMFSCVCVYNLCVCVPSARLSLVNAVTTDAFGIAGHKQGG